MTVKLALGADHAGFTLKEDLKRFLDSRGIAYADLGCFDAQRCDYPDMAQSVANAITSNQATHGVLCCGSGIGMAISANRTPGIRAVVCQDLWTATMSRKHNNANVICFGARVVAAPYAEELLETFLNAPFEGGRHQQRVDKMDTMQQGDSITC